MADWRQRDGSTREHAWGNRRNGGTRGLTGEAGAAQLHAR